MITKPARQADTKASRCDASPTGAHHWVLGAPSALMAGVCKYCRAVREFRPLDETIGFNNSPKRNRSGTAPAE